MATAKQKEAAKQNVKKAQEAWQEMSPRERAQAQPEGADRKKPGTGGEGNFYHIEVRPRSEFTSFRTHDVGDAGGVERISGHRESGSWDTQKWLISKNMAHVENGKLIADHPEAKEVLDQLGSDVEHVEADRFQAKPRKDVPEKDKPTKAQKRARSENIKKAQEARHQE